MTKRDMSWAAAMYCLVMDLAIWVGTGYAVFVLGRSGAWFLLAVWVSACIGVPDGVRRPQK